jgi:Spy/CpxP family protein refolding chaperone
MMMAEGMMKGQIDLGWMNKTLGLSEEQSERLRSTLRPFQKEVILAAASLKVAELELSDVVGRTPVDYGRVDAKLKEAEAIRTKIRLAHIRAGEAVKGILGKEQLEKLQGMIECRPPADQAPTAAPQKQGGGPATGSEHEQHH